MYAALCLALQALATNPYFLLHLPHNGKCYEAAPYIVAVSVASQIQRCQRMRDSAIMHNVPLVIVKHAFKYTTQRFAALIPIADAVHPQTVLLNVDCYDILFLAAGDLLLERYRMYQRTYVIGAEKGAFPDNTRTLRTAYQLKGESTAYCKDSALKYANCGAFATTMSGMRQMMTWMASHYPNSRCLCSYLEEKECQQHTTLANDQACMHRFVLAHWNETALDCGMMILNLFRTGCDSLKFQALKAQATKHSAVGLVDEHDAMQVGGLILHASGKSKTKLEELKCCSDAMYNSPDWAKSKLQRHGHIAGCCCRHE